MLLFSGCAFHRCSFFPSGASSYWFGHVPVFQKLCCCSFPSTSHTVFTLTFHICSCHLLLSLVCFHCISSFREKVQNSQRYEFCQPPYEPLLYLVSSTFLPMHSTIRIFRCNRLTYPHARNLMHSFFTIETRKFRP